MYSQERELKNIELQCTTRQGLRVVLRRHSCVKRLETSQASISLVPTRQGLVQFCRLRCSLLAPPARSYENQTVIRPVGESSEDINWDGVGHRTYINQELGTFYHLLYLGMVTADDR
jgi:hypothetical protein